MIRPVRRIVQNSQGLVQLVHSGPVWGLEPRKWGEGLKWWIGDGDFKVGDWEGRLERA